MTHDRDHQRREEGVMRRDIQMLSQSTHDEDHTHDRGGRGAHIPMIHPCLGVTN